ncbi:MAG: UDP-3-O-[3-hydroxymyristoyl] glucosamine N-acyltransferase [Acidobacteriota bacterium]|jgi:UDP-3-O-[3-hydroxymyristoyl] glucosamine N-acyltransferase|nr:UDP-3-O-[3-hydroxymyristoyl] glucosamine N-acyltransferase [Acidobacteriota bacterium]
MSRETKEITVAELAAHVGGRVLGDENVLIKGIASVESAGAGEIAFVEDRKLFENARESGASCLIVPEGAQVEAPCLIEAKHPKLAFALISELLHPPKRREPAIHPTATIAESANLDLSIAVGAWVEIGERSSIGAGTQIHAGAIIGEDVNIGHDCVLHPNVVLYDNVSLGDRVILHAGVVVGADGFGYVPDEQNFRHKFPQIGTVVIEDDVEVGAGTCIDRAALGRTRIGRATKIDNLVQIAHNVEIGERVVIAAQTGISGSTVIEDDAVIGGQVGMGDHARVMKGAIIGSKAGILPGKIVRAGVWWGIPVQPLDEYKRLNAHINRLPQMREEIKELRQQIKELQEKLEETRRRGDAETRS